METQLYPEFGLRLVYLVVLVFLLTILAVLLYLRMREADEESGPHD